MKENSVLIINGSEMVTNLILLLLPFPVSSCILHQAGLNARQWTLFMPLYAAPVSSCILHQAGLNARQWTLFMPLYAALIRGYFSKIFPRTASTYNTHFSQNS